jgi:hypothetical protein
VVGDNGAGLLQKTKLPAAIYQLRIRVPDDEDEEIANDQKTRFEHHFPEPDTSDLTEEETATAYSTMGSEEISVITWERLYEVANEDRVLVKLKEVMLRGFPKSSYNVYEEIKQYHKFKHDLHVAEALVCYKDRIIIPVKLRPQVLETIHAAHQGVSGMISRVEDTVFWPGICTDIIKTRGGCLKCIRDAPSQPAGSPMTLPSPSFPFQFVVGDYFLLTGVNYLVLGDRFSGWLSIYTASKGEFDAKALVKRSREYFTNFNIQEEIATDGGPQMMSDVFQKSLKAWGIRHRLSSAYNPHSNCRTELAVKVGKKLLRDNTGHGGSLDTDKIMRAVLQYRNIPM